jgi:ankyrin repeat protein
VHSIIKSGQTALHIACYNGHEAAVKLLLDYRAEMKAASKEGWTALHFIILNRHKTVVKLLLNRETEVKATAKKR